MPNPERLFHIDEKEIAVIQLATKFNGKQYSPNRIGFNKAIDDLQQQHRRVMPSVSEATLSKLVNSKDPMIKIIEQMAASAIESDDYAAALVAANNLHAFSNRDRDSLGEAFNLSLRTHRALLTKITDKFSKTDPFLRTAWPHMFLELQELTASGNTSREYEITRGIIHVAVLNGTTGEEAKQQFDPFAVIVE